MISLHSACADAARCVVNPCVTASSSAVCNTIMYHSCCISSAVAMILHHETCITRFSRRTLQCDNTQTFTALQNEEREHPHRAHHRRRFFLCCSTRDSCARFFFLTTRVTLAQVQDEFACLSLYFLKSHLVVTCFNRILLGVPGHPPLLRTTLVTDSGTTCADPRSGSLFGRMAEQSPITQNGCSATMNKLAMKVTM